MALQDFDGFDNYNQNSDILARSGFFQYTETGFATVTRPGRNNYGACIDITGSFGAWFGVTFGTRNASFICGLAFFTSIDTVFRFVDTVGNAAQFTVFFHASNATISIHKGDSSGTQLYLSPNNYWVLNNWFYLEFKTTINSTTGSVSVRLGGVNGTLISLTNINNQSTANAWCDQIQMGAPGGGPAGLFIDDLYYNDTTTGPGTYACNDFIGDVRVVTLKPVGNDQAQFSPNPNTNANWQNVREVAMDSDTTYNLSSTVGQEDRFNFEALPNVSSAIFGAKVVGAYRKDDAGTRTMANVLKSGATEVAGANYPLPASNYGYDAQDLWAVNPATSATFTNSDVNSIKAGYKVIA